MGGSWRASGGFLYKTARFYMDAKSLTKRGNKFIIWTHKGAQGDKLYE